MAENLRHDLDTREAVPPGPTEGFILHEAVEVNDDVDTALESADPAVISEKLFGAAIDVAELKAAGQVVEHLQPHREHAEDGTDRVVFTDGTVSFSFKSPEEYPLYPTQQRSKTTLLTETSKRPIYTGDPFGDYGREVVSRAPKTEEGRHFTVDHTLTGMLRLAAELRPEDQPLHQLASEVQQGHYPERALLILDAMAAASYVNEEGEIVYEPDANGDALVIESLLGNAEAQQQVAVRIARLHKHDALKALADHTNRQDHYAAFSESYSVPAGEKEPQPADFMAIHATEHRPKRDSAGRIMLQTRFDTVGFSRSSLHFSMNHLVESHTLGQFDNAACVVVTPFDKMLQANGTPKNIVGVDTWWTRNPGEAVTCPDATLVEPNDFESDMLFVREGDSLKYKVGNFTAENIDQLVTGFAKIEGSALLPYMPKQIKESIVSKAGSIGDVGLLLQADPEAKQAVVAALAESQTEDATARGLRYLAKKLAVDTVLQEHDVDVFFGGEWSTSGESKIRALAKSLDTENSAHSETPEYRMEQQRHEKYRPSDAVIEDIASLDPRSRRVLMASGIKATRQVAADAGFAFDEVG